jgi:transmembrane 9 superfamily protein 2/4
MQSLKKETAQQVEAVDVQWKKLVGDVGRVPRYPFVLAFLMGTGVQIFTILYTFLVSMSIGLAVPSVRWIWIFSIILAFFGASYFNGYVTARFMKSMGVAEWTGGATASALFFPSFTIALIFIVDTIEWLERASDAPALTTFAL